jgi:predicted PolB exonuclease-like 3'-5' exonuclease
VFELTLFEAFIINVEISTNRLTPYLSEDRDSSYYHNHQVPWNEFCTTFHECHISSGIMCRKLREFLHLQQETDNVNEYIRKFNYLQQYGGYHVHTDEKKAELFRKGLCMGVRV